MDKKESEYPPEHDLAVQEAFVEDQRGTAELKCCYGLVLSLVTFIRVKEV